MAESETFSAMVAEEKGRSGFGWFTLGLLFGIFALIAICGMPVRQEQRPT
jgi:hypothetical protein